MPDDSTPVSALKEAVARFASERDWEQFHSPKNLAMALAVEAAELMEHFLWVEGEASRAVAQDEAKRAQVADEVADVTCLVLALCNALGLDLSDALRDKMARNALKYPVEKVRGRYRVEE
jgi:NTP pyrophosphatase (non-canonical NTP hydrolase)